MKQQSGFTLIELIMVIVILGVLAATALPKFLDLSADADQAAADGVAGAILSSAVITKATENLTGGTPYVIADACTGNYLEGGAAGLASCSTAFASPTCTVTCNSGSKAIDLPL